MQFYSVLKYVLMAVFAGILAIAFLNTDEYSDTAQPQTDVAQPQTKFNF